MALTVNKSMDVSDFWRCWEHIAALVEEEYRAVEGVEGGYKLRLELIWDCDEDEPADRYGEVDEEAAALIDVLGRRSVCSDLAGMDVPPRVSR